MTLDDVLVAAPWPAQLLDDYQPGAFFFSSPTRTLLASGCREHLAEGTPHDRLDEAVRELLSRSRSSGMLAPIAVGAIPFDDSAPARIVVPRTVRHSGPLLPDPDAAAPEPKPVREIRPVPPPGEYVRGVELALDRLSRGDLRKVVLARSLRVSGPGRVDVPALLGNLARRDPAGYTFAVDVPGQEALIGASPELLVSRRGTRVVSHPLAGSAARSADPVEDRWRASALLASAKDRHEHDLVVEAVREALRPLCRTVHVPAEPVLTSTATMWHLATRITGELADPTTSALSLAITLHPTPAVCGTPVSLARQAISDIEPFDRGYYTGVVGWCDDSGDGEWVVTIRCGVTDGDSLRLFAGSGIVVGSRAEAELAETSAKFRTLLLALGVTGEVDA